MPRRFTTLLALVLASSLAAMAASPFAFKFYGRIRGDLFYNSRANVETVDGLFYMYPKDHDYDPDGNDLNATPQGSFYMLYTRLGVDIKGPNLGAATTKAKVEIDFRGSGSTFALPRIRHAYVSLAWKHIDMLAGQTWHPLFGEVSPSMLNLSTGAPFQPFNRSPMLRMRYMAPANFRLSLATIWQMQYTSAGPAGKSHNYLKNSCIPELFLGVDYCSGPLTAGIGAEMLSLCPRQRAEGADGLTYKVSERVTSFSAEAHVKYAAPKWQASAKTALANNLTHCSMLGGFGVTKVDERTGKKSYTPFRHSMTWLNFTYGKKWQPGLFVGYLKNLGTGRAITGETYGTGLDVDQLLSASAQISFNIPAWKFGLELEHSTAWYGKPDLSDGRIRDTHAVSNFRALAVVMFMF